MSVTGLDLRGRMHTAVSGSNLQLFQSEHVITGDGVSDNTVALSEAIYKFRLNGGKIILDGDTRINFEQLQFPGRADLNFSAALVGMTGAKTNGEQVWVKIISTGTVNNGTFQYSLDGGNTYSSTFTIIAAFTIPGSSLTLRFEDTRSYVSNDIYKFLAAGMAAISSSGVFTSSFGPGSGVGIERQITIVIRGRLTMLSTFGPLPVAQYLVWEGDAGTDVNSTAMTYQAGLIVPPFDSSVVTNTAHITDSKYAARVYNLISYTGLLDQATFDWLESSVGTNIVLSNSHNNGTFLFSGWEVVPSAGGSYAIIANLVRTDGTHWTIGDTADWSLNGRSGTGLVFDAGFFPEITAIHVTGWNALTSKHLRGTFVGIHGSQQANQFDMRVGVVGHKVLGIDGYGTGLYVMNQQVTSTVHGWIPPTYPDGYSGSITACVMVPHIRSQFQQGVLRRIAMIGWGVGALFEFGGQFLMEGCSFYMAQTSHSGSSRFSVPIIIDSAYEWILRDFTTDVNNSIQPVLPTASIWLTTTFAMAQFNGYGLIQNWRQIGGGGIVQNGLYQLIPGGPVRVKGYFSEGQFSPLMAFDVRAGIIFNAIVLEDIDLADAAPTTLLDSAEPAPSGSIWDISIKSATYPATPVGSNMQLGARGIRTDFDTIAYRFPYDLGSPRRFSNITDDQFDITLTGQSAALGPINVPNGIEWLPINNDPTTWSQYGVGTVTVVPGIAGKNTAAKLHTSTPDQIIDISTGTASTNWAVGDYIIFGMWLKNTNPSVSIDTNINFDINHAGFTINNSDTTLAIDDAVTFRFGGEWKLATASGKITAISSSLKDFNLFIAFTNTSDLIVDKPFALRIPAGTMPDAEVWRLARHIRFWHHGSPTAMASLAKEQQLGWVDTNIYRDSASIVKTDGSYHAKQQLMVDGYRTVWRQQPNIANADGTIGDITTKFNTLLDTLRTHGLIGGMWNPLGNSSPTFYFDAASVSRSLSTVNSWTDLSGNGYTLNQSGTTVIHPTYTLNNSLFNYAPTVDITNAERMFGPTTGPFDGISTLTLVIVFSASTTLDPNNYKGIISKVNTSNGGWFLGTLGDGTNRLTFYNGVTPYLFSTSTINDGLMHTAIITWDGATLKMYYDNVLESTLASSGASPTIPTSTLAIGGFLDGSGAFQNPSGGWVFGEKLSLAFAAGWQRVLSATELAYLHTYLQIAYNIT